MVQSGKTIAARRERQVSDSERERVRKRSKRAKLIRGLVAGLVIIGMGFLAIRAGKEWFSWIREKEVVVEEAKEPSVEIIDERTGQVTKEVSSRVKDYIYYLEEEFRELGKTVIRARLPADKAREVDLEIEGFSGVIKVSTDRNAAVSAEDGVRMMKYLEGQGISEVQYIDVRVERKGYWK